MNTYPMTSTTFIKREIEALEKLSVEVRRYAVRRWSEQLVDSSDVREAGNTRYFLSGNVLGLLLGFISALVRHPRQLARGVRAAAGLRAGSGGRIKPWAYLLQAIALKRTAHADAVVHVHAHFSTNATAVAMLSRVMGGPTYSFTAHGPDEFVAPDPVAFAAKMEHAAFIVAISKFCRSMLLRLGGEQHASKVVIIHCGIDTGDFPVTGGEHADSRTLVCVGRLCANKAQTLIPPAVALARTRFPDVRVILIGDGDTRQDIERAIAAHGLDRQIEIRGWRPNSEVRELISHSRALLLPSLAEGLPIVIMESLAMGRPVISTRIAGIPELLDEECGWIIAPGSVDELAEAMIDALAIGSEEADRMGRVGRERVVSRFDIHGSARLLLERFQALAA